MVPEHDELDPDEEQETREQAQEAEDATADQEDPDDPREFPPEEEERFRKEKGGAGEARKTNTGRSPEDQRGEPDPKERSSTA